MSYQSPSALCSQYRTAGASNCSWESLLTCVLTHLLRPELRTVIGPSGPYIGLFARDDIAACVVCQVARLALQKMLPWRLATGQLQNAVNEAGVVNPVLRQRSTTILTVLQHGVCHWLHGGHCRPVLIVWCGDVGWRVAVNDSLMAWSSNRCISLTAARRSAASAAARYGKWRIEGSALFCITWTAKNLLGLLIVTSLPGGYGQDDVATHPWLDLHGSFE